MFFKFTVLFFKWEVSTAKNLVFESVMNIRWWWYDRHLSKKALWKYYNFKSESAVYQYSPENREVVTWASSKCQLNGLLYQFVSNSMRSYSEKRHFWHLCQALMWNLMTFK